MKVIKKGVAMLLVSAILAGSFASGAMAQINAAEARKISVAEKSFLSVTAQSGSNAEQVSETETKTPVNGWDAQGKKYYKNGKPVKGWQTIDKKKYYFGNNGDVSKGLKKIGSSFYSFDTKTGVMQTGLNEVVQDDKKIFAYFKKKNGKMQTGYIKHNSKTRYYAKKDGQVIYQFKKSGKYWNTFDMKGNRLYDLRGTAVDSGAYRIRINSNTNVVTIIAKFHDGKYTLPIKAWRCSTGRKSTPSPTGTFTVSGKYRWLYMIGGSYCQWLSHITANYLIHSELYKSPNNKKLKVSAYNKLGKVASHGCVRMPAEGAKWVYDYCRNGTKIVIFKGNKKNDPLGKPSLKKLPKWHTWDPTDPTAKQYCRKRGCHQ